MKGADSILGMWCPPKDSGTNALSSHMLTLSLFHLFYHVFIAVYVLSCVVWHYVYVQIIDVTLLLNHV